MVLTRSLGKHLNVHATLLHGKVQMVELALRIAAGNSGVLNISHRVPFDDLGRRLPGAVLALAPFTPHEQAQYDEYVRYFRAKMRVGVARLDEVDALYIVPPAEETAALIKSLEAAGSPLLPRNMLLGVVAATPGPTAGTAAGQAAAKAHPTASPATSSMAGGLDHRPAKGKEKEPSDDKVQAKGKAAVEVEASTKDEDAGDEDPDQDMSKEALLDLFSNPDLIKSLQEGNDEPPSGG